MRRIVAALILLLPAGCVRQRTQCVYEIPEGYRGWVLIEFERPECPPLQRKDGKFYFPISKSGYLCTSTQLEAGSASDEFYFVGAARTRIIPMVRGRGGLIWAGHTGYFKAGDQPPRIYEEFFVGTEDELKNAPPSPKLP